MVEVLPSLLSADFANLSRDITAVTDAGATMLHVDIMDGHFVPNLTMGPPVVKSIRQATKLLLDCHLMIEDPDRYAPVFIAAGANLVSVHQEVCRHLDRTVRLIQEAGAQAGVVINPATPAATLDIILPYVDYVLVMSVNPGFGGQQFLPYTLDKVAYLDRRRRTEGLEFKIEMDGGLGVNNVAEAVQAGCDWIVAGSAVYDGRDAADAFRRLTATARAAEPARV